MRWLWALAAALVGCQQVGDGPVDVDALLPVGEDEPGHLREVLGHARRALHPVEVAPGLDAPGWVAQIPGAALAMDAERVRFGLAEASVQLQVAGFGRDGALAPVPPAEVHTRGSGLVRVRGSVVEWYRNRDDGLEQGFLLRKAPEGTGPVSVAMDVHTELAGAVERSGQAVVFRDQERSPVLEVTDLVVGDADLIELPSWFEVDGCASGGPCTVRLVFDDTGARWPVTIDPLFAAPEATQQGFAAPGFAGRAVDVSGDWMAVGVPGSPASGSTDAYVAVLRRNHLGANAWSEVVRLDDGGAQFGAAVALDYPLLAVGEPAGDGRVVVYAHDGTAWRRVHTQASPVASAAFGTSVALDGNDLYVGAPAWSSDAGRLYVYNRSEGGLDSWGQVARLQDTPTQAGARFGEVVAAHDGWFAVGVPGTAQPGFVRIFQRPDGAGEVDLVEDLLPSTSAPGDGFGTSVALASRHAAVGARGTGQVHVFEIWHTGDWYEAGLLPPPPDVGTGFGAVLASDDRTVAVTDALGSTLRLHTYERGGSGAVGWGHVQEAVLGAATAVPGALAMDGNVLVSGVPSATFGQVVIHRRSGSMWSSEQVHLGFPSPQNGDEYGAAIAFDGRDLAIGVPGYFHDAPNQGTALHLIYGGAPGTWALEHTNIPSGTIDGARHGHSVAVSGMRMLVANVHGSTLLDISEEAYERLENSPVPSAYAPKSVALLPDLALVGDWDDNVARLLRRDMVLGGWWQAQELPGAGAGALARAGAPVAASANTLAIHEHAGGDQIAIWERSGASQFSRTQTLTLTSPAADLLLAEDRLFVTSGSGGGSTVRIYRPDGAGGLWTLRHTIPNPTPSGISVLGGLAVDGDRLFVADNFQGLVHMFSQNLGGADAWGLEDTIARPPSMTVNNSFARSVAAAAGVLLVGAPGSSTVTGTVLAYYLDEPFAPHGRPDTYTLTEDLPFSVSSGGAGVLLNDEDANGDALTAVLDTPPSAAHGTLTRFDSDGTFDFDPVPDFSGITGFTYVVTDGTLTSPPVLVTLDVLNTPDPPEAIDDAYALTEDTIQTVPTLSGVLANDLDPDNDLDHVDLWSDVANGTLVLDPQGGFAYRPDPDFFGTDTFSYNAVDATGATSLTPAQVTLTVLNQPDPPSPQPDAYAVDEDTTLVVDAATGLLANDIDVDGDPLEVRNPSTTAHGNLTVAISGGFSYTPNTNYSGPDSFVYYAFDGSTSVGPVTVTLDVRPQQDPPTAEWAFLTTNEDEQLVEPAPGLLAYASDDEGDRLTAELVTPPTSGGMNVLLNGAVIYTPAAGEAGTGSFNFGWRACDATSCTDVTPGTIDVHPVNDPPVATPDAYELSEDGLLQVDALSGVLRNDADPDHSLAELLVDVRQQPSAGVLVLDQDGSFTYEPAPDANGSDGFTYQVRDPEGAQSAVVAVALAIRGVNDAPTSTDDLYTVDQAELDVDATSGVLANDGDIDGDPLTVVPATTVTHGQLDLDPDGAFRYTPEPGYVGSDSFTYRASDGLLTSSIAQVRFLVTAPGGATADTGGSGPTGDTGCTLHTWYPDDDADGYGADATSVEACTAPERHLPTRGDCDDTLADIYPGAREIEGDGIDQDCDGSDDVIRPTVATCATGPTSGAWILVLGALARRCRR